MKLFHTSDWHLGRMLYGRSLLEDQRYFLQQVFLPAVEKQRPACVLLAGDLYDRQVPPPEAIALLDETLSRLTELGCKVCAISGNHDGAQRIAIMKSALRRAGVYLATTLEDSLSPVVLEENGRRVQVFLLPYFDTSQARAFLEDDSLRGEGQCMAAVIEKLKALFDPSAAHVLVSHCFAAGALVSESETAVFVGGSGQIPPALFADFDYVALGHLHGPQRVGENGRYSGSPLKYSLDEARQNKGFVSLTLDEKGFTAESVPAAPLRDVRSLSGLFADLLKAGEESPCNDYVELLLTDPHPVLQAAERLRRVYPNLLCVSGQWMSSLPAGDRAKKLQGQDAATIFSAFMEETSGSPAGEEDLRLFREILSEAGTEGENAI